MTSVGIARDGVQLHSCPSCGQHAWTCAGRRLDRDELLAVLRSSRAVTAPRRPPERSAPAASPDLHDLLKGFTPHGTSS